MSRAKTVERIEMPFGLWTQVGLRNHALDWVPDPHAGGNFEGERGRPIVKYRKGKERKSIYIVSFRTKVHTKHSGMDHTVLPANNTMFDSLP